ncbi:aldo/keto reductase [Streptomyces rimosus]|uniref:aldo/keto reductase n=1 Tax=Streptomyces rimosus TaxID=1927 RepID=UPI0004C9991A|nr:aldo/keto reductase [Streptomyces rimosus]
MRPAPPLRRPGRAGIGLSQVTVGQIEQARAVVETASVQNRYNLTDRGSADVLDYCTRHGIGFIPWAPVAAGEPPRTSGPVDRIATTHHAAPSQVALAWLPARSQVVLLGEELARDLNAGETVVIPVAGHLAPLEQPTEFCTLLMDFVRRVPQR